jgi:hypothetical protein
VGFPDDLIKTAIPGHCAIIGVQKLEPFEGRTTVIDHSIPASGITTSTNICQQVCFMCRRSEWLANLHSVCAVIAQTALGVAIRFAKQKSAPMVQNTLPDLYHT